MTSADRDALVALFRSTGGTDWLEKRNWDTDAELIAWHRVQVTRQGSTVKLNLISNNLRGGSPQGECIARGLPPKIEHTVSGRRFTERCPTGRTRFLCSQAFLSAPLKIWAAELVRLKVGRRRQKVFCLSY